MLEKQLEILEDNTFAHGLSRSQHLEAIQNALDKGDSLSIPIVDRILAVCVRDLQDVRHAASCLSIITKTLRRYQSELPVPKLVSTAEAVLNFTLTAASLNRAEALQTISFHTLLAYPDEVLAEVAFNCNNVYELFNLYCHLKIPVENRFQPIYLARKVLNKLTTDKRGTFVKKGLAVWFSRVVPCAMTYFQTQIIATTPMVLTILEVLEMLTDELAKIDYAANAQWKTVLESIYNPNEYPAQVKNLLVNGSVLWHRIWIIFIKLLKTQITVNKPGFGSPINSMLPVVEMAFKMDVKNRCKAFKCWNVLIDNFSAETNELFVNKRLKLLIIPLRSNNAKVEETALAKLDTWWHLIKRFEARIDDKMLYPFLHFCFGRHVSEKTVLIPGMISPNVKKNCMEVFVEMVGHVNCEGCTSKARLNRKLISTEVLVDHWSDWSHSLKIALKVSAEDEPGIGKQLVACAWKSFVMTIGELPENNLRADLFNDLLKIMKDMAEGSANYKMADIVNNILISSLLEENTMKQLLKSVEFQDGPLHNLISILIDPTFVETCHKYDVENLLKNMKLIVEFLIMKCPNLEEKFVEWLIIDGVPNDNSLQLWTTLLEALQVSESRHDCLHQLCNLLLWPLKNLHHFTNVHAAALMWYSTYCVNHLLTVQTAWFHSEINRILSANENNGPPTTFFILCVRLAVTKAKIIARAFDGLDKELKQLRDVICKYDDYNEIKQVFPVLIDTLHLLSSTAASEPAICEYDQNVFLIGKQVLNIVIKQLQQTDSMEPVLKAKVINAVEYLFKIKGDNEYKAALLDRILECRSLFITTPVLSNLDSILKSVMSDNVDESLKIKIKAAYENTEDDNSCLKNKTLKTKQQDESKFTTPVSNTGKKNSKKKETSIVNTVVENGEEFAVIKSNWKFNPRKLTENQKEKLQRKREDIPALYQDLSQSQDEFKLKSWKADSQDTSATNSGSATVPSNDSISTIKKMPGTDIVPKIIDNFFSDTTKSEATEQNANKITISPKPNKVDSSKSSPSVKTPRMALKDRVFRNVKNLIEKSSVPKEVSQKHDLLNQTVHEKNINTPVTKCKDTKSLVNSAPSKISADRPARVKRKPKKFDDTELYLLKKRRNSSSQNESQYLETIDSTEEICLSEKNKDDLNNTLKVTTVSDENPDVLNNETCKLNTLVTEVGSVDNIKSINASLNKLMVAEVTSSSVGNTVIEKEVDSSNGNPEVKPVVICPLSLPADKSIEETQQLDQLKEPSDSSTSTPNQKPIAKSTSKKRSRIEKELAIDMVEGHPFLKLQSDKRITRKCLANTPNSTRRKSLSEKLNKSKTDPKSASKQKKDSTVKDLSNEKSKKNSKDLSITVCETQDISSDATQDLSEDVIESSQDTTTTISVKSFRSCTNKQSPSPESLGNSVHEYQNLIDISTPEVNSTADVIMTQENKDDTELPANKTAVQDNATLELTADMDTEPTSSGEVIIINEDAPDPVIDLNTNDCVPGPDTLELANADTQPTDASQFENNSNALIETGHEEFVDNKDYGEHNGQKMDDSQLPSTADDRTITLVDISQNQETSASSPSRDDDQRKKDFLNNTSEISPIKLLSPIEPKSPSPETSSDFIVIKLSGPVQINGEPLEMSNSPEIFTEERISPDKRDQSPPRAEATVTNSSPSSSLSLKKNRPQVRSGGRAAQMLGLCVPDRLQIMHVDRSETEEPKKSSPVNTPARRNLRMLYQTAVDSDSSDGKEEGENFLKFKKTLPTADCSPSGPILKRKLADIADEATVSPANKRKRVSFHDPVSTSVSVQKYIETSGLRSPQNSALKRLERQLRLQSPMKSPKRLESLFKLDSMLTKTIESFNENDVTSSNDTELSSIEQTPAVEVVKTSELNDTDPIFPDLIDCKDSIDNIASELSSPAMRLLLVKELEGKIETIGDLAKLPELEVNRLCIKAPKIQVVKKVLVDYASRRDKMEVDKTDKSSVNDEPAVYVDQTPLNNIATQTNNITNEIETQTSMVLQIFSSTQTDLVSTLQKSTQTNESGHKSTEDIIQSCLKDREDFVLKLSEQLENSSKMKIAENLPVDNCTDLLVKNMTSSDANNILDTVIKRGSKLCTNQLNINKELSFLQNYLCDKFDAKELILFCSQILQKIYDKNM